MGKRAAGFFAQAFAPPVPASSIAALLGAPHPRGWDVKRTLIWMGTQSFLFRFGYADYMAQHASTNADYIAVTDDFLCQQCTAWSGFGVLDLPAAALDRSETDRTDLRAVRRKAPRSPAK